MLDEKMKGDDHLVLGKWLAACLVRSGQTIGDAARKGKSQCKKLFREVRECLKNPRAASSLKWWAAGHFDYKNLPAKVGDYLDDIGECWETLTLEGVLGYAITIPLFARTFALSSKNEYPDTSSIDTFFVMCGNSFVSRNELWRKMRKERKSRPDLQWKMGTSLFCPEMLLNLGRTFIGKRFVDRLCPSLVGTCGNSQGFSNSLRKVGWLLTRMIKSGHYPPKSEQNKVGDDVTIASVFNACRRGVINPEALPTQVCLEVYARPREPQHWLFWPQGVALRLDDDVSLFVENLPP